MTIFLEIAKECLKDRIYDIKTKSIKKDSSTQNQLASFFGCGRDENVSKNKRTIAEALDFNIKSYSGGQDDAESFNTLKELVKNARLEAKQISDQAKLTEGDFGPAMLKTISLLEDVFDEFKRIELLNVAHDPLPLNIFKYHIGSFLATKIFERKESSPIEKLSGLDTLTVEKENLAKKALNDCIKDLNLLDKKNPDYKSACQKRILENIDKLDRAHSELLKRHGMGVSVPVPILTGPANVSFKLGTIKPNPGDLGTCILLSIAEITKQGEEEKPSNKNETKTMKSH